MKRNRPLWITGGLAAGALGLVYWQLQRLFTEEPAYRVEKRVGPLEVRSYGPAIRAETSIDAGDWREALNIGFRRLANYIFGGNRPRQDFTLAAPVRLRPERIAMTAPVAQTSSDFGPWKMAFTMPHGRALDSLPIPVDSRVHLTQVPPRRVAVLRFSGRYTASLVHEKTQELRALAEQAGIPTSGQVEFAGYDPPTTVPFLRRNEVWVEVAPS